MSCSVCLRCGGETFDLFHGLRYIHTLIQCGVTKSVCGLLATYWFVVFPVCDVITVKGLKQTKF